MRYLPALMFASVSSIALAASPAAAQPERTDADATVTPADDTATPSDDSAEASTDVTHADIHVNARRKDEALADVPASVNVVTGAKLEELLINTLGDLDKVVAGLQINGPNVAMRGVSFTTTANSGNTVATYLNEAPVSSTELFTAIFDVGQTEVLRGPQGTVRGIAAPSGAITLTTRRPDLSEIGGFLNMQVNNHHGWNVQGALNIPIIEDMLGLRLAGLVDQNDAGGVRSLNNPKRPFSKTIGGRVSLRFEPTEDISINVAYHNVSVEGVSFGSAVFGNGAPGNSQLANIPQLGLFLPPGFVVGSPNPFAPPGYNGPPLTREDNRAVQATASRTDQDIKIWMGNAEWSFAGQKLEFVGSRQFLRTPSIGAADAGNMLLGFPLLNTNIKTTNRIDTYEARLVSDEPIADIFDYSIGVFHRDNSARVLGPFGFATIFAGAFGPPGTIPNPRNALDLRYTISQLINFPVDSKETSFFGNLTAHIGDKLEVSGGVRRIHFERIANTVISTTPAVTTVARPPVPAGCALVPGSVNGITYPNTCDIAVPARVLPFPSPPLSTNTWVWDAAASFDIMDDLLVYAHAGSSWRQPFIGVGIGSTSSLASQLAGNILGGAEKSKGWEVGAKWEFLNRRGHLFVDYFQQNFEGLIFGSTAAYLSSDTTIANPFGFFSNVPAKIKGFEVEFGFNLNRRWNILANYSRAKGRVNGIVPCTDTNFDGTPDNLPAATAARNAYIAALLSRGTIYATCLSTSGTSTAPDWNVRAQSEFRQPITNFGDVFVRGLFQYQPKNRNASTTFVTPAYGLLDLFVGVRASDGAWEVSAFGRNITNTSKLLSDITGPEIAAPGGTGAFFGTSGYRSFTRTPRREFGLSARLAFGSR